MRRGDLLRRVLVGIAAVLIAVTSGTAIAAADEPDPAKKKAADAVAVKVCSVGRLDTILKTINLDDDCLNKVSTLYADGPEGITAKRVCNTLVPGSGFGIPRTQCRLALAPVVVPMIKVWQQAYDAAKAVKKGVTIAKWVANPQDGIDSLANQTKQAGVSLAQTMATDLVKATPSFDANQGWWGAKYRQAMVLGLALLAAMTLWTIRDAAVKRNDEELVSSILIRLPLAVLAMCFAPAIGLVITNTSNAIARAAVPTFNADLDRFLERITNISSTTAAAGSPMMGILLFGLLFVGVALTICALLMHTLALYLTGAAMAIIWGLYVNPRWRPQVNRAVAFWISTAFAKPLLIFMLGVAFAIAGNIKAGVGGLEEILNIALAGLTILLVGLTPLALLKFIPLLPASTESMRPASGGSIIGAAASGAAAVAMSRGGWGAQREKTATTTRQTSSHSSSSSSSGSGLQNLSQRLATRGATVQGEQGQAGQGGQSANQPGRQGGASNSPGQAPNNPPRGGQSPPSDPGQATRPVTETGGTIATGGAIAAGRAAGGPASAMAAAALAAAAKQAGEKARQTAAGTAPDIARNDGGERR